MSHESEYDSSSHSIMTEDEEDWEDDDEDDVVSQVQPQQQAGPSQAVVIRQAVPPYGQRRGWKPTSLEDFGAQYRHSSHRPCLTFPQAMVERIPNAILLNTL